MRLSKFFKLSFVGSLIFSPGMAQEADRVHDEALKLLRSQTVNTNPPPSTAAPSIRSSVGESRTERDARLKAEAQQRLAERERLQAEKRRQFEEYVKERERLRQQQRMQDDALARQPGRLTPASTAPENIHDKALEVLRQQQPASSPTIPTTPTSVTTATPAPSESPAPAVAPAPAVVQPAPPPAAPSAPVRAEAPALQPSNDEVQQKALKILRQQRAEPSAPLAPSAPPVTEAEVAPRVVAAPAPVPAPNTDTHQKALEVLRQEIQSAPAAAPSAPARAPRTAPPKDDLKPSPDLQRRLDEIQRELNTPAPRSARSEADTQAYLKELEGRALQNRPQSIPAPVTTPAIPSTAAPITTRATPALDPKTRDIIRRQDQQIRQAPVTATPRATTAAVAPASNTLDAATEARAREILRQQQQAVSAPATAATTTQPNVPAAQPVPATPPTASTPVTSPLGDMQYSRELEERARRVLLERAGTQPSSSAAVTTTPTPTAIPPAATPQSAETVSNAPLRTDPELERIHSRALETLVQVQPGEGAQTQFKSKQERIRALTDLYRADKLTPAEYHQRRAQILAEPNK